MFLRKWTAFVRAFGGRYSSNPTVTAVKISGINSVDEETSVPYGIDQAISNGTTSCTGYNDVANWQAAGYLRSLIERRGNRSPRPFRAPFRPRPC